MKLTKAETKKINTFDILATATRYMILAVIINQGPITVESIAKALKMSHSATSHQLMVLTAEKIVQSKKQGRHQFYTLAGTKEGALVKGLMNFEPEV